MLVLQRVPGGRLWGTGSGNGFCGTGITRRLQGWREAVAQRATLAVATREITQRELRNESGEIMRQLDDGATVVVTRNGMPVGELPPLRRHRFVRSETVVALFHRAPPVDLDTFRRDLDRVAAQDVTPRA